MKITPEDIIDLIRLSKTPSIDSGENRNQIAEINRDLTENGLEIEGYERAQWTKFDPSDPKTFPPDDGKNVLGYNPEFSDEPFECFLGIDDNFYCPQDKFRFPLPTHWRPLPKPPTEKE